MLTAQQAGAQLLITAHEAEERLQGLTHTGLIQRMPGTKPGALPLFHARESL